MRGRPCKPTALHVIEGTFRKDRSNSREPQPKRKRPPMPPSLSAGAKQAWRRFAPMLDKLGVLTEADAAALASLCEAFAEREAARASLAARGSLTYENVTAAGGVTYRPYPEIKMIADADRRVNMWLTKFGLSPVDRARVSRIEDEQDTDPAARFLR